MKRKFTWKPDVPDQRDFLFIPKKIALPSLVDLRKNYSKIYNQGPLGSCTANAIAVAIDFERIKQKLTPILPSRLFIYYNERALEGSINEDSGAMIRDGIKTVSKKGVCREYSWPYKINKYRVKPPAACYTEALSNEVTGYLRLQSTSLINLKTSLALGYGFVFGFSVYESFESNAVTKTGIVPMPKPNESLLGGHAVFCIGYDDAKKVFIVRNSWGAAWGDKGHFYLPYSYVTNLNLADDFWSIRVV